MIGSIVFSLSVPVHELGVVVGENYADRGTPVLTVVFIVFHEDFNPDTLRADIAMLRTFEDVTYRSLNTFLC